MEKKVTRVIPDKAMVDKERSLEILGEVFDVEIALRRLLKDVTKHIDTVPEAIVEINTKTDKPHKRAKRDIDKVRKNVPDAIDNLTIGEIEQILKMEPAKLVHPEVMMDILVTSKDFSEAQRRMKNVAPPGTFLSLIGEYILVTKVSEKRFLKLLNEMVVLRNLAGHWHPVSQKNINSAKEIRKELLSMLRVKVPKTLEEQLSQLQLSSSFTSAIESLQKMIQKMNTYKFPDFSRIDLSPFVFQNLDPITGQKLH